jgi:hypothetical protein
MKEFFAWITSKGHKLPAGVEMDSGKEFRGAFARYLTKKTVPWKEPYPAGHEKAGQRPTIHRYVLKLVPYVEARNAHIQRAIVMAIAGGKSYEAAVTAGYRKVNRIKSQTTGKMPEYFLTHADEVETYADIGPGSIRSQRRRKPVQRKQKRRKWKEGEYVNVLKARFRGDKAELVRSYVGAFSKASNKWSGKVRIDKALANGKYKITFDGQTRWYTGNELRRHVDAQDPGVREREAREVARAEKKAAKKKRKEDAQKQQKKQKKKKQLAQALGKKIPKKQPAKKKQSIAAYFAGLKRKKPRPR